MTFEELRERRGLEAGYLEPLVRELPFGVVVIDLDRADPGASRIPHFSMGATTNLDSVTPGFSAAQRTTLQGIWDAAKQPDDVRAEMFDRYADVADAGETKIFEVEWGGRMWMSHVVALGPDLIADLYVDVTDLHAANAKLERTNADLEQFAYIASHDLREPARTVLIGLAALFDDPDALAPEQVTTYVRLVREAAARQLALITDLLAFFRSGVASDAGPVSLDDALADVCDELSSTIEETGASVYSTGALPMVHGSQPLIRRVISNLVGNALKFRREGIAPDVCVSADVGGGWTHVTVSDNGIGIAAEHVDIVTEPFRRLHSTEEYAGTGIGLALCVRIAQAHGGSLRVESAGAGLGTSVTISLPASGGAS